MQGDVQGRCRVRQPADRDAIHTGTGDYPDVGERDPAGDLQDRCTVYGVRCTGAKSDRPTNVRDQPVIQEDCVRLRLQRGFKLVQIRHLDFNECPRFRTFGSGDRPLYQLSTTDYGLRTAPRPKGFEVIGFNQNGLREITAMIAPSANSYSVFL